MELLWTSQQMYPVPYKPKRLSLLLSNLSVYNASRYTHKMFPMHFHIHVKYSLCIFNFRQNPCCIQCQPSQY